MCFGGNRQCLPKNAMRVLLCHGADGQRKDGIELYSRDFADGTVDSHRLVWAAQNLKEVEHETITLPELDLLRGKHGANFRLYQADSSSLVPGTVLNKDNMFATLNVGTSEYAKHNMDEVFERLGIRERLAKVLSEPFSRDKTRGNNIRNYGISSGKNLGAHKDPEKVLRYHGACAPRILQDTFGPDKKILPEMRDLFLLVTEVGRIMGIDSCQPDFLDKHPEHKDHISYIEDLLGLEGTRFATLSFVWQELDDFSKLKRHSDDANDNHLPGTIGLFECFEWGGKRWRAGFVVYNRQSVTDALVRGSACEEAYRACVKYRDWALENDPNLLPGAYAENYFLESVGTGGAVFTYDTKDKRLYAWALRTPASADKCGNFQTGIVAPITKLVERQNLSLLELASLLAMIGTLCSYVMVSNVLCHCVDDWDRQKISQLNGGVTEYVYDLVCEVIGCMSGGPGRRCMNFNNKDLVVAHVRNNVKYVVNWIQQHRLLDQEKYTTVYSRRKYTHDVIHKLANKIKYSGTFSATSIAACAALAGAVSPWVAEYAVIAHNVTQNKKNNPKTSALQAYLQGTKGDSNKKEKSACVITGAHRCYEAANPATTNIKITESVIENVICEGRRSNKVHDTFMCSGYFLRLVTSDTGVATWQKITPLKKAVRFSTDRLADQVKFKTEPLRELVLAPITDEEWESFNSGDINAKISIGRKDQKSDRYFQGTLAYEDIKDILDDLKLRMIDVDGSSNHISQREHMDRLMGCAPLMEKINHAMSSPPAKKKRSLPSAELEIQPKKRVAPTRVEQTLPIPVLHLVDLRVQSPAAQNWNDSSERIEPGFDMKYRVYSTTSQLDGTVLVEWMSFKSDTQLQKISVTRCVVYFCEAHAVFLNGQSSKCEAVPRMKSSTVRKKRSQNPPTVVFHFVDHGQSKYVRAVFNALGGITVGVVGVCRLQDKLARSLGGEQVQSDGGLFWYFNDKMKAKLYMCLCYVCICGTEDHFKKLIDRSVNREERKTGLFQVGVREKPGPVDYYLIGRRFGSPTKYQYELALAVPGKAGGAKKPLFVRLL